MILQSYSYTIEHKPGVKNTDADGLSRRQYDTDQVNNLTFDEVNMAAEQRKDSDLQLIINYLKDKQLPDDEAKARRLLLRIDHYLLDDKDRLVHLNTLNRRSHTDLKQCLVIPSHMRADLLHELHESNISGHSGNLYNLYHQRNCSANGS